jgi:hypothetical protein
MSKKPSQPSKPVKPVQTTGADKAFLDAIKKLDGGKAK